MAIALVFARAFRTAGYSTGKTKLEKIGKAKNRFIAKLQAELTDVFVKGTKNNQIEMRKYEPTDN